MFYTNVLFKNNRIYFKGYQDDSTPIIGNREYNPYIFVDADGQDDVSYYRAFYNSNQKLIKKHFDTVEDVEKFLMTYKSEPHGIGITKSDVKKNDFAFQFISETFKTEVSYQEEFIKIMYTDIETRSDRGFPVVDEPTQEILMITSVTTYKGENKYVTFGLKEYTEFEKYHPNKFYIYCKDEGDMLLNYVKHVQKESPDILSGYNSNSFDYAYLISRIEFAFNKEWTKKLSPFGLSPRKIQKKNKFAGGNTNTEYEIYGVSQLDMLELYRKYTFVTRESYSLNNIANIELGEKKLDYSEFKDLQDLYEKDWERFLAYNIVDCELLVKLENKLKLIELVIGVAYLAKVNFSDVLSPVKTWDIYIYNHLLKNGVAVPIMKHTEKDRQNIGGYVKEPRVGFCEYVVTLDASSMYPSTIMSLNISPETFVGMVSVNDNDILHGKTPTSQLKKENYILAANGALFDKSRKGIIVDLIQKMFDDRGKYKEEMFRLENENGDENLIKKYDVKQSVYKVLMNSFYGALSNSYFRYFNLATAEAVTVTSRVLVQTAERTLNQYINEILKTSDIDYTVFSDTDSCAVELKELVNKFQISDDKVNVFLDRVCKEKFDPLLKKEFEKLADYLNFFQNKIYFKREMIVRKGFVVAKKKYAMNVLSKEKIVYDNPKLIVKGLEIVRSSTPEIVRGYLKDIVKMILETDEQETQKFIKGFKEQFFASDIVDISFPRGVSELGKFVFRDAFVKGTPIHVRASLNYNSLIDSKKLHEKYEYIKNGDKIKFLYLKLPNPTKQNVIAFKDYFPEEFDYLKEYIDYETQFQKTFVSPLESIFESIGWEVEKKMSFADFF